EPLGDGAVGVVHPAIVEFTLQSGEKVEHNLTLKLAFNDKQRKGLMNEYRIYRHLSGRKGVKGIPTIHGVFRDPELNTLGMLMSDAGRSLRHREKEKGPKGRKVSGKQKKAFIEALQSFHKAGVRHNDIRPENLLINSEGQVSIIDFDRADFDVTEHAAEEELRLLVDVLDGWDDPFLAYFKRTFDSNYDSGTFQDDGVNPRPDHSPVTFYDRHIASNLLFKKGHIYAVIRSKSFQDAGHRFPTLGYNAFPSKCRSKTFRDANDVQDHCDKFVTNVASRYASRLVLHPESPTWDSIFRVAVRAGESDLNFTAESWLTIDRLLKDQMKLFSSFSATAKKKIKALELKYPRLANWDMFAMTEFATTMFQKLTRSVDSFKWETYRTSGYSSTSHLPVPPDAREGLLRGKAFTKTRAAAGLSGGVTVKIAGVIKVPRSPTRRTQYRPDFCHYIQHAWATAAAHDTTFMVLHCGRYERIGLRHRASQTLYLSGVIDTINARNPSYRKLSVGLYIYILRDALQRLELTETPMQETKKSGLKRSANHLDEDVAQTKRLKKCKVLVLRRESLKVSTEIARRRLAVVRLEYGAYCSPVASSFVRTKPTCLSGYAPMPITKEDKERARQTHFGITERFSLTLKEPLGRGAIGIVHPAIVEVTLQSGEIVKHNLVLKLAFTAEQQEGLENEYRIYNYLSRKKGVKGIPTVHGVFRDPELDVLAMLMSDAGQSLRSREAAKGKEGRKVSEKERKAFVEALQSLHKAGVRHNDIRPENLLIGPDGQVSIIDLDRADFNVAERLLKQEIAQLNKVLDGYIEETGGGKKEEQQQVAGHGIVLTNDPFSSLLRGTLDANYDPEISQEDEDRLKPVLPLSFYDRHIASHLVLENIVYLPSLAHSLSKICETSLGSFLKAGGRFSSTNYNIFPLQCPSVTFKDATSVCSHYHRYVGNICSRYAYKFSLRPNDPSWESPTHLFIYTGEARPNFRTEAWLEVTSLVSNEPEVLNGLDELSQGKVKGLLEKYPRLATWDFFAMTEEAQAMFQTLRGNCSFDWVTCRTLGSHTVSRSIPPPDAKLLPVRAPIKESTKSCQSPSGSRRATTRATRTVTIPKLVPRNKSYRQDFRHYIQHVRIHEVTVDCTTDLQQAWAKAAVYDSTFIILHCGRYERIGLRHRASKTLFLSGVIDTINIKNPSYRKLHIGLHTAIILDALKRQDLARKQLKKSIRRTDSADHLEAEVCPSKRPNKPSVVKAKWSKVSQAHTNDHLAPLIAKQVTKEIAQRTLALVRLDYGAFCSPAPSAFVRRCPSCLPGHAPLTVSSEEMRHPKQTSYQAGEYFSLTLGEPLGRGAVGVVHGAKLELELESGEMLVRDDLVIKLAFTTEQQKMMAKEYEVYGHLSRKKNVKGIVAVHGLFLDPETRTLGMLMDNGGRSLHSRETEEGKGFFVTEQERSAFIQALQSLHRAGVRHNDLRADNLLINSRNEVFIIDFDQAGFRLEEGDIEEEMGRLEDVLEGCYY
ncbi:hypothetical protein CVT26_007174, partial [Gymnopilus dilepis]